ncbi:MAG: LysM peptidoglycan-binding domain-containing M23 family metallopeptidase [Spirochaetaceae bacterium]|jgi:murein DD-endopeptidase MepM/ murein hydrolase activator NlpD|nr:LysM peptidoglycan-binding domain-containing M23 family metallopeptidase [Spirochaetaceae bacterium]
MRGIFYGRATAFLYVLFLCFSFDSAGAADGEHIVKSGETVYSISRKYGVKVDEILFINEIENANKVMAGQKLRIPSGPTMALPISDASYKKPPERAVFINYKAEKGDTLYGLSRRFGVSVQDLTAANNYPKNKMLKIGETVKIPAPEEKSALNAEGFSPLNIPPGLPADKLAQPLNSGPSLRPPEGPMPEAIIAQGGAASKNTVLIPASSSAKNSAPASSIGSKTASKPVDLRLKWPIKIKEASYMTGKLDGVVLTGEKTAPVQSISSGTVASAGPYRGFGRVAIVQSDSGYIYVYGGCEQLSVKAGERVAYGEEIGRLGVDAASQKPRLFFMVYNGVKAIDPAKAPRI